MKFSLKSLISLNLVFIFLFLFSTTSGAKTISKSYALSIADKLFNKGIKLEKNSVNDKALTHFVLSAKIYKKLNNYNSYGKCLISIGNHYCNTEQYSKAEQLFKQCDYILKNKCKSNKSFGAELYEAWSDYYYSIRNYEKSISKIRFSIELKSKYIDENSSSLSSSYNQLGRNFRKLDNFNKD